MDRLISQVHSRRGFRLAGACLALFPFAGSLACVEKKPLRVVREHDEARVLALAIGGIPAARVPRVAAAEMPRQASNRSRTAAGLDLVIGGN